MVGSHPIDPGSIPGIGILLGFAAGESMGEGEKMGEEGWEERRKGALYSS